MHLTGPEQRRADAGNKGSCLRRWLLTVVVVDCCRRPSQFGGSSGLRRQQRTAVNVGYLYSSGQLING